MNCRITFVIATLLFWSGGHAAIAEAVTLQGNVFGTSYSITLHSDTAIDAVAVQEEVDARLDEIDRLMSTYRDDSEVSRFNRSPATTWISVSLETASLVQRAIAISEQTDGAFDTTIGPLVALWNFGAGASEGRFEPPTDAKVRETLQLVGFQKMKVRLDPPSLWKEVAGLQLDLSAIAKGYAVDQVGSILAEFDHVMVEIGGEVLTRGVRPDGGPWRIGLEAPVPNARRVDAIIPLKDQALATSGDYRNFHTHGGVTYSHTVNPKTGRPVDHQLASVTVLASTCENADALATALSVMGPERGRDWANQASIQAMLVSRSTGGLVTETTADFPKVNVGSEPAKSNYFGMFLVTAAVFGIAILAMSVGTIVANRRLQGSCGGMAGLKDSGGKTICDMCTKPSAECSGEPTDEQATVSS